MTSFSKCRLAVAALLMATVSACAVLETGARIVNVGASVVSTTVGVAGTVAGVGVTAAGAAKTVAVTSAKVAVATIGTAINAGTLAVSAAPTAASLGRADDVATATVVAIAPDRFSALDGRLWITRNCGGVANGQPALWVARRSGENEIRVNEGTTCPVVTAK